MMENQSYQHLEVNLISAQGLKSPSATTLRRLQSYAIAWVDPSAKLRTRLDRVGGENPTWNDKFIFRVTPAFLKSETSGITVEIYTVGVLKDPLIGTARILVSNILPPSIFSFPPSSSSCRIAGITAPAFNAFQIRRPSGRFQGVLNVGAMVISGADFAIAMNGATAIGYRDLMGQKGMKKHRRGKSEISEEFSSESHGLSGDSDGAESTTSNSSSSAASSVVLMELNGRRDVVAGVIENGGRILCGLGFQRKYCISTSDVDDVENVKDAPVSLLDHRMRK